MFTRPFEHLRTTLLVSMLAVVFLLTAAVLALVQVRMRAHVSEDLASTLRTESSVSSKIEEARRQQSEQSAALIANLPSLKAMMSTRDPLTIQDGSKSFLETSGADVLILADLSGTLMALHSKSQKVAASSERLLLFPSAGKHDWWFINGRLYDLSFAQVNAGAGSELHALGLVALGWEVTPQSIAGTDALADSPIAFERDGRVLLSSLDPSLWGEFQTWLSNSSHVPRCIQEI